MLKLQFEREKRGLSRAELARRSKVQASDIGKIESGRAKPYERQLKKLGRGMRMRVAESLTLGDELPPTLESALAEVKRAGEIISAGKRALNEIDTCNVVGDIQRIADRPSSGDVRALADES